MVEDVDEVSKVIIKHGSRVLFLQKSNNEWELPGGHLNRGESFKQGAKREVLEETGIKLSKLKLVINQKTFNLFRCKVRVSKVILSHEHIDYCWVTNKSARKLNLSKSTLENWHHILKLF